MKYICLHHSGVSKDSQYYQFLAINRYHKEKNWGTANNPWYQKKPSALGFWGGYNFLIEPAGQLYQYRKIGEETIAARGHNFDSIHIALTGNFSMEMPTKEQIDTLRNLLKKYMIEYSIPAQNILPHRRLQTDTNCNGVLLSDDWGQRLITYHEAKVTQPQMDLIQMAKILDNLRQIVLDLMRKIAALRR